MKGIVFDIKDFALNDGQGIRTTVFLKGCPLRCVWCHNPEGLSPKKELFLKRGGCLSCGLCRRPCTHPECADLGRCLHVCPLDLVRAAGEEWEVDALARRLLRRMDFWRIHGGGVTLSGGEPLLQDDFCSELLERLNGVHRTIETSGYALSERFRQVVSRCDFVYMDLKLFDDVAHRRYTGVSNDRILQNATWLMESGLPFTFRVPLIPTITDSDENLVAIARFVGDSPVELLPYNRLAGAKYASVGRNFELEVEEERSADVVLSYFKNATLRR